MKLLHAVAVVARLFCRSVGSTCETPRSVRLRTSGASRWLSGADWARRNDGISVSGIPTASAQAHGAAGRRMATCARASYRPAIPANFGVRHRFWGQTPFLGSGTVFGVRHRFLGQAPFLVPDPKTGDGHDCAVSRRAAPTRGPSARRAGPAP